MAPTSVIAKQYMKCRAKKVQDERNADARLYHKDTSTLSVKVNLSFTACHAQCITVTACSSASSSNRINLSS